MTDHEPLTWWDDFEAWDGHTSADVVQRLRQLATS